MTEFDLPARLNKTIRKDLRSNRYEIGPKHEAGVSCQIHSEGDRGDSERARRQNKGGVRCSVRSEKKVIKRDAKSVETEIKRSSPRTPNRKRQSAECAAK